MLRGIEIFISLRLNCKGCTHYSPIAPERYADPFSMKKTCEDLVSSIAQSIQFASWVGNPSCIRSQGANEIE